MGTLLIPANLASLGPRDQGAERRLEKVQIKTLACREKCETRSRQKNPSRNEIYINYHPIRLTQCLQSCILN